MVVGATLLVGERRHKDNKLFLTWILIIYLRNRVALLPCCFVEKFPKWIIFCLKNYMV